MCWSSSTLLGAATARWIFRFGVCLSSWGSGDVGRLGQALAPEYKLVVAVSDRFGSCTSAFRAQRPAAWKHVPKAQHYAQDDGISIVRPGCLDSEKLVLQGVLAWLSCRSFSASRPAGAAEMSVPGHGATMPAGRRSRLHSFELSPPCFLDPGRWMRRSALGFT